VVVSEREREERLSTGASSGDKERKREGGEGIIYVASHEREIEDWIEAPCGMQERKEAWLWGAGCKVQDGLVGTPSVL